MAVSSAPAGVYASMEGLIAQKDKARGFSFLPRQPLRSLLSGKHASRLRGRGLNFEEIRRYFPGDDVRQIDWKATLRTGHTQLRVYTEERERTVLLVVDQRRSMFFGSQRNMKSVTAAETAALAAWRVLDQGDRVGAIVFNDSQVVEIRPKRSRKTVMQILHAIREQNAALSLKTSAPANPGMLNHVLYRAEKLAKHDCLVCLITDGRGQSAESNETVSRISRHNDVLVAFIYDPFEAEIPPHGPLVVSDGVNQLEIDTDSPSFHDQFKRTFEERVNSVRQFLLHREIPVIRLTTTEGVAEQLRRSMGGKTR